MAPSSLTLNYDAILSTTLFNVKSELQDAISTSNAFFFKLFNGKAYKSVDSIGERAQIPLMYALAPADSYSGYDILDTTAFEGITSAFYDWRQFATHVSISGKEEKQNKGENAIVNLLKAKTKQAVLGIQEKFSKAFLQGNGLNSSTAGQTTVPYVSPSNGSTFIDPISKLIDPDPTDSVVVGNINQNTYSWWQNQMKLVSLSTPTYAKLLVDMRNTYNNCGKGPGGYPDLLLCDQATFELYERALAATSTVNVTWQKADIPFDNVQFRGNPLTWDEFVVDAENETVTQTYGTIYMINTKFFEIQHEASTNFDPQGFKTPDNQDAKVNQILWMGAALCSNRRKQGVLKSITTSITA